MVYSAGHWPNAHRWTRPSLPFAHSSSWPDVSPCLPQRSESCHRDTVSRDTGVLCPPAKTSHSPLDHCSRCSKPLSHQAVMGLLLTLLCHTLSPSLLSLYLSLLFYKEAEAALIGPGNSAGLCPDCPVSAGCFRTRDVLMSASLLVRKSLPDHKNVPFHDGPCA